MTYTDEEYKLLQEQAATWRTLAESRQESINELTQKAEALERDFVAAIETALEAKRHA